MKKRTQVLLLLTLILVMFSQLKCDFRGNIKQYIEILEPQDQFFAENTIYEVKDLIRQSFQSGYCAQYAVPEYSPIVSFQFGPRLSYRDTLMVTTPKGSVTYNWVEDETDISHRYFCREIPPAATECILIGDGNSYTVSLVAYSDESRAEESKLICHESYRLLTQSEQKMPEDDPVEEPPIDPREDEPEQPLEPQQPDPQEFDACDATRYLQTQNEKYEFQEGERNICDHLIIIQNTHDSKSILLVGYWHKIEGYGDSPSSRHMWYTQSLATIQPGESFEWVARMNYHPNDKHYSGPSGDALEKLAGYFDAVECKQIQAREVFFETIARPIVPLCPLE